MSATIEVDQSSVADFCRRHHIRKLSLFGSVLRDDFRPESDIDVLVEFEHGAKVGLRFFAVERELSEIIGYEMSDPRLRSVDVTEVVVTPDSRHARVLVHAGGTGEERGSALVALEGARHYLRRELASRLRLFRIPELHFEQGPLEGLKLIGFSVWERKSGNGRNVTFPARQYSVNGERRSFALLRPLVDATSQDRLRDLILQAYTEYEAQTVTA